MGDRFTATACSMAVLRGYSPRKIFALGRHLLRHVDQIAMRGRFHRFAIHWQTPWREGFWLPFHVTLSFRDRTPVSASPPTNEAPCHGGRRWS